MAARRGFHQRHGGLRPVFLGAAPVLFVPLFDRFHGQETLRLREKKLWSKAMPQDPSFGGDVKICEDLTMHHPVLWFVLQDFRMAYMMAED